MTEDGVQDSMEVGLEIVHLFKSSGDFATNHDGQIVKNLNGVVEFKEPKAFENIVFDQEESGHAYDVFTVVIREAILGLVATGGSVESNATFENELVGGSS
jgi:hypothetical protein